MEQEIKKSWFQKNWIWAVPVGGCGCGCIGIILLFVFGIGATLFGISKIITDSEPVTTAIELVQKDQQIISIIGNHIEKSGIPSGNISIKNSNGNVDLIIPIKGDIGKATLTIKGNRHDKKWEYTEFYVIIKDTQEKINLLAKALEGL